MSDELVNCELKINSLIDRHEKIQNEIVATINDTVASLRNDFSKNSVNLENLFETRLANWEITQAKRLQSVLNCISTPDEKTMIETKSELEAIKEQLKNHIYWMSNDLCAEMKLSYGTIAELERSLTEKIESVAKGLEEEIKLTIAEHMDWMRKDCSDEVQSKLEKMEFGVLTRTLWRNKYTILFSILAFICILKCNGMC